MRLRGAGFVVLRFEMAAFLAEDRELRYACSLQCELHCSFQHAQAVGHASAEVDAGGFFEIFRRAGDFADAEVEVDALGEHLVVEDEVVAVFAEREAGQDFAAEGSVTGVVFTQLHTQKHVRERGQQPVRNILVKRHAAAEGCASDDARAEDHVVDAVGDHAGHGRD